jgi:hypothetical protein
VDEKLDRILASTQTPHTPPIQPADVPVVRGAQAGVPARYSTTTPPEFSAVPFRHVTAPENMLLWPFAQRLLPRLHSVSPLELELGRPPEPRGVEPAGSAPAGDWLDGVTIAEFRCLTRIYFAEFHPQFPVLSASEFESSVLGRVLGDGFNSDVESCLVLLVLSLGCVGARHHGDSEWQAGGADSMVPPDFRTSPMPGSHFYDRAWRILQSVSGVTWRLTQCLLLAGYANMCSWVAIRGLS